MTFSDRALAYFAGRAINPALAWECGVRERTDAIVWPTVDVDGRYSPRRRILADDGGPKVRGRRGVSIGVWWPLGRPARLAGDTLICEGESDAMAAASILGASNGVSVATGKARSSVLVAELCDLGATIVALAFDGDIAGGQSADRIANEFVAHGIGARILDVPYGHDLASVLAGIPEPDGTWPEDPLAWLMDAMLRARPVGLEVAALVAENNWLRAQLGVTSERLAGVAA